MADTKISALAAAGALAGTEPLPVVQGGVTKKTTVQDVANLAAPAGPVLIAPALGVAGAKKSDDSAHVLAKDDGTAEIVGAMGIWIADAPFGSETFSIFADPTTNSLIISGFTAFNAPYLPGNTADWNGADPTNIVDALDRIAARLGTAAATTTKP